MDPEQNDCCKNSLLWLLLFEDVETVYADETSNQDNFIIIIIIESTNIQQSKTGERYKIHIKFFNSQNVCDVMMIAFGDIVTQTCLSKIK